MSPKEMVSVYTLARKDIELFRNSLNMLSESKLIGALDVAIDALKVADKYDYRYDHTDCIWYRDSWSRCPVTCAQYRDGWNDAMQYIFCGGKGYSPYVREERKN